MFELRRSQRVQFYGSQGRLLSGIVDQPADPPSAFALFSHCFTCSKDLKAIVRISRRLAEQGIGVLRYDFAGIGDSEGDFSDTNFSTNLIDLQGAAEFLSLNFTPPKLLIGHSFGGAASLAAAESISSVQGVALLAAPSNTSHLADLLERMDPKIATEGIGQVTIGGRNWRIKKQMTENLRSHDLPSRIAHLTKPVLIFHSPEDETVGYEHAMQIFSWLTQRIAHQPNSPGASLISLPGADHLLIKNAADIPLVADTISVWLQRLMASSIT